MQDLYTAFVELLETRRGKCMALKGPEIANLLGTTDRHVRTLTREARRNGLPICADVYGYYYAANDAEWVAQLERLRGRSMDMLATTSTVKRGWSERGKPTQERMFV